MITRISITIKHLENYCLLLKEHQRLLNILEQNPDDENTFDLLYDIYIAIENNGIYYTLPEDLDNAESICDLIDILQNEEANCLTDAIQLCRVKKLLRLS
ncbi:MAG: hypothetical protein IJF78_01525 [Clostridia bacterium]|nr:hypothetical protein [Clostridia bacterium]